jgi:hypothetical protein
MYTAVVYLDFGKALDTTRNLGLLYELSELKFSISLIKLISSFLSQRTFGVLVKGEMTTPRYIHARGHTVPSCPPRCTVYICKWYAANAWRLYLGLFADDTCIYATDHKEGYVRKLQQGLSTTEMQCEHWNI